MLYCGPIVYILFAKAFDTSSCPGLQLQSPANLMRHPVVNPIASLPGASQPGDWVRHKCCYSAIACVGKTSALFALAPCIYASNSSQVRQLQIKIEDGHTCAAESLEAKLLEMEKRLQKAEAHIERLTHGSLQQALLPQPPIPVSGTISHSHFSTSELQSSSLQVPRSAILDLLSCLLFMSSSSHCSKP